MNSWKQYQGVLVCTFLLAVSLSLPGNLAHAESEATDKALEEEISDATVNLYCRVKLGRTTIASSGSGVFIDERGVILTNAHVAIFFLLAESEDKDINGSCSVRTGSPAEETYEAALLYIPSVWIEENLDAFSEEEPKGTGEYDFALLYVTDAEDGDLPLTFPSLRAGSSTSTREGDSVLLAGYPIENLSAREVRNGPMQEVASSTITNIQRFTKRNTEDRITLADSPVGSLGSSGGPVVDPSGEIIALISNKSTAKGDQRLRAITLFHINHSLRLQTAFVLPELLQHSFSARALLTKLMLPEDTVEDLIDTLLKQSR